MSEKPFVLEEYIAALDRATINRDYSNAWRDEQETADAIKELCRPHLSEFELEGDSYGVPRNADHVEYLAKKCTRLTTALEISVEALELGSWNANPDCREALAAIKKIQEER